MSPPVCLLGAFRRHLESRPDARLYRYLIDGTPDGEIAEWTFAQTYARGAAVAELLAERGWSGKRVLLVSPPGLDYIAAFLGCLMARVVAVPAYPPSASRVDGTVPRLAAIAAAAQIEGVIASAAIAGEARALLAGTPVHDAPWLCVDAAADRSPSRDWLAIPAGDAVAYLQFTSGSTSEPRGVMVTHGNLGHNSELICRKLGHGRETRGMSWLPPYHDMGLIGGILQPIYYGGEVTLMSPADFLKRPIRWLEAISRFGATTSGGPDFGYALCARRYRAGASPIDLSSWRVAFTGAEPIRGETLDRFCEAFGRFGFARRAFYPCYGLAEATLLVTGGEVGEAPRRLRADREQLARGRFAAAEAEAEAGAPATELVSCGAPGADQALAIVDPARCTRVPDGEIGEIWVAGPSVAAGYWGEPAATREGFAARIAGEPAAGPFARTGDLGFVADGELYVTGRHKDAIVVRGRNLYPQDLEDAVAAAHPAIRAGGVAAFRAWGADDGIAVAAEVTRGAGQELGAVISAIRGAIAAAHGAAVTDVVLLPARAMPRTSSGKLRRAACRDGIADGSISAVARWRAGPAVAPVDAAPAWPAARLRAWLCDAVARRTGAAASAIDAGRPLVEYGVDSAAGVEIAGELEAMLDRPVAATLVWDHPTIDAVAAHLAGTERSPAARTATAGPAGAPIAIVAVGCRFPGGVDGPESLWRVLCGGVDPIGPVPASRWAAASPGPGPGAAAQIGGFVDRVDEFDAAFFAISPREARSLDPQHRLLLEVAYETLDRAGLANRTPADRATGVFVGISGNDYHRRQDRAGAIDPRYAVTGNLASVAAGRIAYALGLTGPAIAVDTACSSSLVAVHLACQSLRAGDCERALAGGVNLILSPDGHAYLGAMGALSGRGRCASFDASADGYVRSEGCGLVLLRPLEAAQRDGDRILAVIRDSAINHDGRSNGLTAPSGPAQVAVIRRALGRAGVRPEEVGYVEAHGTGTPLGDPIEAQALAAVFGGPRPAPLRIGSIKSNLGHAEAAAGVAGPIKVALALDDEILPGNLHFAAPNPRIPWAELPLSVVAATTPWPRGDAPRFAGVSSFGLSGTNVHVVLEQAAIPAHHAEARGERRRSATAGAPWQRLRHWFDEPALPACAEPPRDGGGGVAEVADNESIAHAGEPRTGRAAEIRAALAQLLAEALRMPAGEIDPRRSFLELGADSMVLLELAHGIERELGVAVAPHQLFEPLGDLAALAAFVAGQETAAPPLAPAQRRHLDDLIRRYTARTAASKQRAERYRGVLADRRATAGFAAPTKELQYPISAGSARGARLRDVDGNDYIDVAMGFGVHLFGHAPDFVRDAITAELAGGAPIGPACPRAGELAEQIAQLTGHERVAFCSSGTEAVMTALRLARAATGRSGVALFRGSYHGHSDGTLALGRRGGGGARSIPMAPGVPQGAIDDVIILDYGDPGALDAIRGAADRLAAVLVEPIQSLRPDARPERFVRELRALTRERDVALIFDEVVTGFRVHPRGAQGLLGVDADLATYGKLLGGGLPIGAVAGARRFLDRIDGGAWRFGDASHPAVETTFFAGTFAKNPLTVAASLAVVREIAARGPALYDELDARTARLERGMNERFAAAEVPLSLVRCGSMFRIAPRGGERASYLHESLDLRLLHAHLIHRGVYVWEGRTGFVSTAHTDDDIDRIVAATGDALGELRAGGFFARAGAAPRAAVDAVRAPLSWAQEGVWLQAQLEAGTGSFNMPGGVRLRGDLCADRLERALAEVVRRHAVLRTRFETVGGRPQQVIVPAGPAAEIAIARVDWRGRGDHREALRRLALDEARRPFDLERGPLVRVTLIALGAGAWALLVAMHHLIGDAASFGLFVEELAAHYRALRGGDAPPPPPPAQYADHAREDRARLDGDALARQLAYWKHQLAGAPPSLSLPTDRPRRGGAAGQSATLARPLAPELVRSLRDLAARQQATLHMVLLAGFAALLARHTGQDDLAIGAPVTTRDRAALGGTLGLFVNTVVLRLGVDRTDSFAALVQRARDVALGAYAHKDAPFGHVVQAVQPERVPGRHPLFQIWFNLEPVDPVGELRLPGVEVEPLDDDLDAPTQLDLGLCARPHAGGLALRWIYNEALFDRATIEHLAEQLDHLLAQVAADPAAALASHSLVTARAAGIVPDPAAPLEDPGYARITDQVARQAERAPDRAAIAQGPRTWSYAELVRAAAAIADGLARSTRRGDAVAVRGAPSFGLVAAMLGALLCDRVLLPLDPALPLDRQAVMLRDAGARCVAQVGGADRRGAIACAHIAAADAAWSDPPARVADPSDAPHPPRAPGDAYIFYTSGTTGAPKAVLGTHRGLAHFIDWQRREFDVGPRDRIAQTVRLSFDAVLRDVLLPLASGATLVLPEDGDLDEPAAVLAWLARQRITLVHTVPSLGQHWIRQAPAAGLPDLRRVLFSGEPLRAELVQSWRRLAPAAEVINLYGPTETTMIKCYYRVPGEPPPGVQPAGIPLPHTQALVLTPERARCGVGEIGEIVIRTAYGTRGYLGAPDPGRFIRNPHRDDGIGLYCTGDRGRHRADGQLQVLGRADRQIKLRGVRIELAELEAAIGEHPGVRQASVQVVGDEPSRHLVAFVVADEGVRRAAILARLRARLPEAMLPARLELVAELPRLASGKLDAAALIARAAAPATDAACGAAPATPTQALVAEHVRDLLGLERVGPDDDFFALGGHSLLGAQLVARVRRALGVEIGLRALFDHPSVAGFSAYLDRAVEHIEL